MTRARSLSRLANSTVFTVSDTNRVGIGSTIPDVKLDVGGKAIIDDTTQSTSVSTGALVVSGGIGIGKSLFVGGDMSVAGTLTYEDVTNTETAGITTTGGLVVTGLGATFGSISTHFSNIEFGAAGVGGTITPLGHAEFVGVVTASSFSGDGSGLTGVASTDNINTSTLAQFTGGVGIADSIFHIGDDNTAIRFPGNDTFTVTTSGSEALRIDGSQRLLMGRTSTAAAANRNSNIQLHSSDASEASITIRRFFDNTGDNAPARLVLARSGSSSDDFTIVADDNRLGEITFAGADGTDLRTEAANIRAEVDGTPGSNDMPGRLIFSTNAGGEDYTERLRITSGGDILVAKTTTALTTQGARLSSGLITVSGDSNSTNLATNSGGNLSLANVDSTDNNFSNIGGYNSNGLVISQIDFINKSHSSRTGEIAFLTHNGSAMSERLRIGSSGQIGLGGANYGTSGQVLTSNGSGSAVTWEDASGGGGITTQVGNASGIVTSMFLTDATDHKVTATGICTITTTQAGTEGQSHTIRIVNSGIATVGFSTYFLFPSGSAPSLPTADGAVSLISFTVHDSVGAGCTQLLAGASVNFS